MSVLNELNKTQYWLLTEQILERSVDLESGYFTANGERSQIQDENFSQSKKEEGYSNHSAQRATNAKPKKSLKLP